MRNVVEYGKYSSAKLANLYTFVSRAEIGNQFSYQFTHVIQKYTNLPTLKGYIFRILYCKARFPNRTLPKRAVFHCFLSARVELMTLTQKKILVRYVTMKWKTGLIDKWFEWWMYNTLTMFTRPHKVLFKRSQHVGPTSSNVVGCNMLASFEHYVGWCWIMLEDVSLSLNLLKIFVQHRATLLAQQCCTMLASFEQALINVYPAWYEVETWEQRGILELGIKSTTEINL